MPSGQTICLLSGTFNNYYDLDRTREIIRAIRKSVDLKVIWARAGESPELTLGVGENEVISVTHFEMPDLVRKAHFGMAICKEDQSDSLAAAVPTKIGEFLASGRPVIVSKGIGDMDAMLADSRTGLVVSRSASLDNVGAQIQELIVDQDLQERCREVAMEHFDMDKAVVKYSQIYMKMREES